MLRNIAAGKAAIGPVNTSNSKIVAVSIPQEELIAVLATQSIKAREQQEGRMQACTIGLSINKDLKLEKGKEKKGSVA